MLIGRVVPTACARPHALALARFEFFGEAIPNDFRQFLATIFVFRMALFLRGLFILARDGYAGE
jgi:hypothetical protein